jgi:hypothetical protein
MCKSPLALTIRSIRAWRAKSSSMWSRKPIPVEIDARPAPSRSISTSTSVSLVLRLTEPLRMNVSSAEPRAFYQGLAVFATPAAGAFAPPCQNA